MEKVAVKYAAWAAERQQREPLSARPRPPKPNVQKVRVVVNGRATRLNVCTRCLRSGNGPWPPTKSQEA